MEFAISREPERRVHQGEGFIVTIKNEPVFWDRYFVIAYRGAVSVPPMPELGRQLVSFQISDKSEGDYEQQRKDEKKAPFHFLSLTACRASLGNANSTNC